MAVSLPFHYFFTFSSAIFLFFPSPLYFFFNFYFILFPPLNALSRAWGSVPLGAGGGGR